MQYTIQFVQNEFLLKEYTLTRILLTYISILKNDYNNTGYILLPKKEYQKALANKLILLPNPKTGRNTTYKDITVQIYKTLKDKFDSQLFTQGAIQSFVKKALNSSNAASSNASSASKNHNYSSLLNELTNLLDIEYPDLSKLKQKISKFKPEIRTLDYFHIILQDIVPEIFEKVQKMHIKIAIVPYGSVVSYSNPKKIGPKEYETTLLLREDSNFTHILEGYLSSLVYFVFESPKNVSWYTQEQFVDFLIQYTKLNMLFKDYVPTIFEDESKKDVDMDLKALYTKSREFLRSMGFDQSQDLLLIDRKLVVHGVKTNIELTQQEAKLLNLLLLNRNHAIDYFYIGDILWPNNPDKFSLWAIAKLVQKIRYKLYKAGFDDKKLMNVKGKGYMLA